MRNKVSIVSIKEFPDKRFRYEAACAHSSQVEHATGGAKTDVNTFIAVMKCVPQHFRKIHGEESGRRNIALLDTIVDGELLRELAIEVDLSHYTAVQFLKLVNESR